MTDQTKTLVTSDSAAVVETSLLAFGAGMSVQSRTDVKNSFLFASLAAAFKCSESKLDEDWFSHFLLAMRDCGWVIAKRTFERENTTEQSLTLANIVLEAVRTATTGLIGGAAVSAIMTSLADQALQKLPKNDKAMELFKRNFLSKNSATVGLAACKQTEEGEILMAIGAAQHMTSQEDVGVIFFDWDGSRSTTFKSTVSLSFNPVLYERVRASIEERLGERAVSRIAEYQI